MGEILLEVFGAVTGLVYVWLEVKHRRAMWVVGFVMSACYVAVFLRGLKMVVIPLVFSALVMGVSSMFPSAMA
jgi:Na+/H+-dicarboxylate symporter